METVFRNCNNTKTYWLESDKKYITFVPNIENYKEIYDNKNG